MRRRALLAAIAVCVAASFAAAGEAQAPPPPCSADDLAGARIPAVIGDFGLDTLDEPLVTGARYRIVVVRERGIGDRSAPVEESIAISAPDGPPLRRGTADGRPFYDLVPPRRGTLRLVVSWVAERSDGGRCSAVRTVELTVVDAARARPRGSFSRGRGRKSSAFTLRLRSGKPQDMARVEVILRARRGTTRPPAPRGRALARFRFEPTGDGSFTTSSRIRGLARAFFTDAIGGTLTIYPEPNIPFGRPTRFAFSLEVRQGGRRVGGMRAGASCRRIQHTSYSVVRCHPVGLRQRP